MVDTTTVRPTDRPSRRGRENVRRRRRRWLCSWLLFAYCCCCCCKRWLIFSASFESCLLDRKSRREEEKEEEKKIIPSSLFCCCCCFWLLCLHAHSTRYVQYRRCCAPMSPLLLMCERRRLFYIYIHTHTQVHNLSVRRRRRRHHGGTHWPYNIIHPTYGHLSHLFFSITHAHIFESTHFPHFLLWSALLSPSSSFSSSSLFIPTVRWRSLKSKSTFIFIV